MDEIEQKIYLLIEGAGSQGISQTDIIQKTGFVKKQVEQILQKLFNQHLVERTKVAYHDKIEGIRGDLVYTKNK